MVWGLNNFGNSSIFGENWYKAKTGGVVSKTAKSCLLWENSWADTLESGYIMATEYRKEAEKNFTRSTSRISANKYHNIYRFCQGQGALLHMLCMCKSSTIIHNTPCVPEHSYYWLEGKWNSWERKQYFHKVDQEKHANRRANIPIMNSEVYQLSPLWTQAISTPPSPNQGGGVDDRAYRSILRVPAGTFWCSWFWSRWLSDNHQNCQHQNGFCGYA